jgi:hypothetical protein
MKAYFSFSYTLEWFWLITILTCSTCQQISVHIFMPSQNFNIPALWNHFFCFGCSAVSHIYNSFSHTSFTGSVNLKQNITMNIQGKDKLKTGNFICNFAFLRKWRLPNDPVIKIFKYFNYSIKYTVWLIANGFQYMLLIWLVLLLSLYDFTVVFGTWHSTNSQQGLWDETYAKTCSVWRKYANTSTRRLAVSLTTKFKEVHCRGYEVIMDWHPVFHFV